MDHYYRNISVEISASHSGIIVECCLSFYDNKRSKLMFRGMTYSLVLCY